MVEHSAVNRVVVGSSPTRGVGKRPVNISVYGSFYIQWKRLKGNKIDRMAAKAGM